MLTLQSALGEEKGDLGSAMVLLLSCLVTLQTSPCPQGFRCIVYITRAVAWLPPVGPPSSHPMILEAGLLTTSALSQRLCQHGVRHPFQPAEVWALSASLWAWQICSPGAERGGGS